MLDRFSYRNWFVAALTPVFFAVPAFAEYDLKLACNLAPLPSGVTVLGNKFDIEVDERYGRARVLDSAIEEKIGNWLLVDRIKMRNHRLVVSYLFSPLPKRYLSDKSKPFKNQAIKYQLSVDLDSMGFVVSYSHTSPGQQIVRLTGRCKNR